MMQRIITAAVLLVFALIAVTGADAQTRRKSQPKEVEHPIPAAPTDKRDSVVAAPGPFNGKPYWLALAQCGGTYFKLNIFYADIAVHARAVKPDPKAATDFTKKLTEAIKTATTYYDGAEHFLMIDRGIERVDAVLAYVGQSDAAADRVKTIDAAVNAAKACPVLYQACQQAYPKACSETLPPTS
jgi:hypothetical protein